MSKETRCTMRKIIILLAALMVSWGLSAQDSNKTGMEWIEEFDGKERVIINPNYGTPSENRQTDYFYLMPLDEQLVALYGSRYRDAVNRKFTGCVLIGTVAVLAVPVLAGATMDMEGLAILSGIGAAVCLGVGVPLWISGAHRKNAILDDYARNYAPRPYSASLSAGPTRSGVGLAFNF